MSLPQTYRLVHDVARQRAIQALRDAPNGYCVVIKEETRTLSQNAKLWPMLNDVARQVIWYGNKLSDDEWKDIFTAALKKQKVVPGIDGGFVVCGQRTSTMPKREFCDLIELIYSFGAQQNVLWSEQSMRAYEESLAA